MRDGVGGAGRATLSEAPEEITGQPRRTLVGSVSLRRTFSALRHRNFRLFFVGQLVSLMGTWMQNTALSWLVYQLTNSKMLLGLVAAAGTAPMLFFSLAGGSLADRYPKRAIILCTQTAMMLLAAILALLTFRQSINPTEILVLSALGGVAMAFDMPARQAFLIEITSRQDLLNAVSLNSAIVNGARVVGPAMAGFVMAKAGATTCFLINAISFMAVIGGLLLMRIEKSKAARPVGGRKYLVEGLRYVIHDRRLKTVFALFAMVGIFGWSYSVMMPAFATDVLHLTERGYGFLLGANGCGALFGALTTAALGNRFTPRSMAFFGLWVFAGSLFALSVASSMASAMACLVVSGWGMMLFFSTVNTLLQTSVRDSMRGRVMGIWALVFGGMMPLGSLEAGWLSHWLGIRVAIAIGAGACAAAGLVAWTVTHLKPLDPIRTDGN
jgi:MFS family permease